MELIMCRRWWLVRNLVVMRTWWWWIGVGMMVHLVKGRLLPLLLFTKDVNSAL
jgi:hypothetical protein